MVTATVLALLSSLFAPSPGPAPGPAQPTAALQCEISATYLDGDGVVVPISEDSEVYLNRLVTVEMTVYNVGQSVADDLVNSFAVNSETRNAAYLPQFAHTTTLLAGQSITQVSTFWTGSAGIGAGGSVAVFTKADSPGDFVPVGPPHLNRTCTLHFQVKSTPT